MKKIYFILFAFAVALTSCQKVSEKNLYGKWEVETILYQGETQSISPAYDYWHIEFKENGDLIYTVEGIEAYGTYLYSKSDESISTYMNIEGESFSSTFSIDLFTDTYLEVYGEAAIAEEAVRITLTKMY